MHPPSLTPPLPIPITPVAGTHGYRGQLTGEWWCHGSPVLTFLHAAGFPLLAPGRPFVWSTDVNGWKFWRRLFRMQDKHHDWTAAGHGLYGYFRPIFDELDRYVPIAQRNLVVHSHGLQPALYACELGLRINTLISVMSPVRADMMAVAAAARPNIGYWEHVHADKDRFQWWGAVGDGAVGINRRHPLADRNTLVKGVGHAKLLRDPAAFTRWIDEGILDRWRAAAEPALVGMRPPDARDDRPCG